MKAKITTLVALAGLGLSAACATVTLPPADIERSSGTIHTAEALGANSTPAGKLLLQVANDEQTQANNMAADGDPRAYTMLSRAQADAELALELARHHAAQSYRVTVSHELERVKSQKE